MSTTNITLPSLSTTLAFLLAFEFLLGGQARITPFLTPAIHRVVMDKARTTREALSFIPVQDAKQHTQFLGCAMCLNAILLVAPRTRCNIGVGLTLALTGALVRMHTRLGESVVVPVVNSALVGVMVWSRWYREV